MNIASIAGKEGNAGMLAYSSSKAAVIGLTKVSHATCNASIQQLYMLPPLQVMGKEYAETGITVNALAPAVIRTEMVAAMPAAQVCFA